MLRHFCRRANGRALVGRWSVTRRDAPLDHPQASPAHNDKRHSILLEGPACLSLPPASPFTLRFRRRFLSRGTVCYCMCNTMHDCLLGSLVSAFGFNSRWVPPPW